MINKQAYHEGHQVAKRRMGTKDEPKIDILYRALNDCADMHWEYLYNYFKGMIEAMENKKERKEGLK